jgi:hypothetical protein
MMCRYPISVTKLVPVAGSSPLSFEGSEIVVDVLTGIGVRTKTSPRRGKAGVLLACYDLLGWTP